MEIFQPGPGESVIELDLQAEAASPQQNIRIEGQPSWSSMANPGNVLLENARLWLATLAPWTARGPIRREDPASAQCLDRRHEETA